MTRAFSQPRLLNILNSSFLIVLIFLCSHFPPFSIQQQLNEKTDLVLTLRYGTCKGFFPEQQCECEETRVACVNSQLRSPDMLGAVWWSPKLRQLTFHGNNFGHLPERVFTNITDLTQLTVLNLSANYVVTLHPNAFLGLPSVEILDLSDNEIILNESMNELLLPLRNLRELYLRRAFRQSTNRLIDFSMEKQMRCLENMLRAGNLNRLERLDLSMNAFSIIRPTIFCPLRALTHIFLSKNRLRRLEIDSNCIRNVKVLDLRDNHLVALDRSFYQLAGRLPFNCIRLQGNPFECYCNSSVYISWLIRSDKIIDKTNLTCDKASPGEYVRTQLLSVPVDKLTCPLAMANSANSDNLMIRAHSALSTKRTLASWVIWSLACVLAGIDDELISCYWMVVFVNRI